MWVIGLSYTTTGSHGLFAYPCLFPWFYRSDSLNESIKNNKQNSPTAPSGSRNLQSLVLVLEQDPSQDPSQEIVNALGEGDKQDALRPPDETNNTINIYHSKTQQVFVRRKITRTCNAIDRIIVQCGSSGSARALLQAVVELLAAAEQSTTCWSARSTTTTITITTSGTPSCMKKNVERLDEYIAKWADDAGHGATRRWTRSA